MSTANLQQFVNKLYSISNNKKANIPQIPNDFLTAFLVFLALQSTDVFEQFLEGFPVPIPQRCPDCTHALPRAAVVPQPFQVFFQMETVQYMARIGKVFS